MRITCNDYEKFYFGEASEKYIQSEFYSQGYEALKTSPDIGYDLLVTNCARTKFLGEPTRQYNIQVKSRVCYENTVCFFIDEEDFNCLLEDENGYLICVLCKPEISEGRENITIYRDYIPSMIDNMCEEWEKELLKNTEYLSLEVLKEKRISYVGYTRNYVWFNNAQLKRLKKENLIYNKEKLETGKDNICINIDASTMTIIDKNNKPYEVETNSLYQRSMIAYEQQYIKYLVECNSADNRMFEGDIYL